MTRLTRAELVDLVRRLVESLGDGGLSRTLCIEAERALKAEEVDGGFQPRGSSLYQRQTDRLLTVEPEIVGPRWQWTVNGFLPGMKTMQYLAEGYASTESEAQQAALDAARRMA
jgi:hypothetical protein